MKPALDTESPSRWRRLAPFVALALLAVVPLVIALSAGGHSKPKLPNNVRQAKSASYKGSVASPINAAPPIALHNQLGQPVSLRQYRGKVALVTFLYTHCPDVCPLIAGNLHATLSKLVPAAKNVQTIAVSVDPHGDTPEAVKTFLRQHDMTGRMQYLIGSPTELARTWKARNVGSQKDAQNPEFVAHSALVYGITASGKLATLYPANFKPTDVVHDVALLAKS
jgi:protein SCO1/2